MPTYGYRCTACGNQFERFQKITDDALTVCETCGGALKKLLYPVGIAFKGPGFYVNDSKSAGEKPAAKSEANPSGKTDTATETKSGESSVDSKSADTSTPAPASTSTATPTTPAATGTPNAGK